MRTEAACLALAAALLGSAAAPTAAPGATTSSASGRYSLGYFLPRGRAAASYSMRLVRCPTANRPDVEVEVHAQIVAKTVPDYARFYRIDARAGFLAKRSTELSLNADGTLKSVNATVEGQGAAVLIASAKLASFALSPVAAGAVLGARDGPPRGTSAADALPSRSRREGRERNAAATVAAGLEARLTAGPLPPADAAELASAKDRVASLDDALTIASDPQVIDGTADGEARLPRLDYASWFDRSSPAEIARLPADDGVRVTWTANRAARAALAAAADVLPERETALGASPPPAPILYYRRPVPVSIAMTPCTAVPAKTRSGATTGKSGPSPAPCNEDASPAAAPLSTGASAAFPQMSGLFVLAIGRGGLFGSRTVAAEFDATGAPTTLKYGSEAGTADIAATLAAVQEAGTTLRDARADALARQDAILKSRKDIRDLEAELDK